MNRKAVIFDMDGVLVDSEPFYVEINRAFFDKIGLDLSLEEQMKFVGIAPSDQWKDLKGRFDLDYTVEELISREAEDQFHVFSEAECIPKVPGVSDLLDSIFAVDLRIAVGSSSARRIVDTLLDRGGLADRFEVTVSGDEVPRAKPEPDIFLRCAELLGCAPEDCAVIEDSPHGIAAAAKAGMLSVGLQNPNSGNQDLSEADLVVPDFSEGCRSLVMKALST